MHEALINALKAKFEGVSDNIISRFAKNLSKSISSEEQIKEVVGKVTLQQLIDSYADSRATEAAQTAVHNYESKYNLKDGSKVGNGGVDVQTNSINAGGVDQTPEWAKALIEANKSLTERLTKMEGANITANRKTQISNIVAKLPETLRKPYERIAVEALNDDEFNTLVTEVTAEVDGIAKDVFAKGAVFGRPTASSGNKNELTEEQQKAIASRDSSFVSGEGQPF